MGEFGNRLESLRDRETQKGFAKSLGIPINTYTNWVRGIREPSMSAIINLCTQLSVSADWLLGLSDTNERGTSVTAPNNSGAIAVGRNVRATSSGQAPGTKHQAPIPDCLNCKYKRLADAFKAL